MSKSRKKTQRIKPQDVKTRDPLMVALINGATKAGVEKDQRKEKSRRECREFKYKGDE